MSTLLTQLGTLQRVASSTTSPAEPVTVPEVKRHLRITESDDDHLLAEIIPAAREMVETEIGGASLRITEYDWTFPSFPASNDAPLAFPKPPLYSVSSVGYVDTDGSTQTWGSTNYTEMVDRWGPGYIVPRYAISWPSVRDQENACVVRFNAGCASTDVPQKARAAIKMLVGDWYENPENQLTGTISAEIEMGITRLARNLRWGNYK